MLSNVRANNFEMLSHVRANNFEMLSHVRANSNCLPKKWCKYTVMPSQILVTNLPDPNDLYSALIHHYVQSGCSTIIFINIWLGYF